MLVASAVPAVEPAPTGARSSTERGTTTGATPQARCALPVRADETGVAGSGFGRPAGGVPTGCAEWAWGHNGVMALADTLTVSSAPRGDVHLRSGARHRARARRGRPRRGRCRRRRGGRPVLRRRGGARRRGDVRLHVRRRARRRHDHGPALYHLLRSLGASASVLAYLRLDRTRSNLAAARRELAGVRVGRRRAARPSSPLRGAVRPVGVARGAARVPGGRTRRRATRPPRAVPPAPRRPPAPGRPRPRARAPTGPRRGCRRASGAPRPSRACGPPVPRPPAPLRSGFSASRSAASRAAGPRRGQTPYGHPDAGVPAAVPNPRARPAVGRRAHGRRA